MSHIYIIGSGIVGISCALNLLEKGYSVTVIDQSDKIKETSFGNAGVITRSSAYLINNKNLVPSLRKYIWNTHPAVRLNYAYIMKNITWAYQFINESFEKTSVKNIHALDSIIRVSLDEHKKWLTHSNQLHKLRENGWFKLFRKQHSLDSTVYEQGIYRGLGVQYERVKSDELYEMEPALNRIYTGALFIKDAASVDHPGEVTEGYQALFRALGGNIIQDRIRALKTQDKQILLFGTQTYEADKLVLAAGPWSNDLLKTIDAPLPMGFERGYHEHFAFPNGPLLTRPVYDVDSAFVLSPTSQGYRLSSGSELKDKGDKPTPTQLEWVIPKAKEALALGQPVPNSRWMGSRPTLPDSLPALGPSHAHPNLWLAFGHQHVGFSTGPASGRLIAEMIHGESTFIGASPFLPSRFY